MRNLLTLLMLLSLSSAANACVFPAQKVDMPDGKEATKEEMVSAQKAVKSYVGAMDEYIVCLEKASESVPEGEEGAAERAINTQRHNSAVDAMSIVADRFNLEVRAYKAAQERPK